MCIVDARVTEEEAKKTGFVFLWISHHPVCPPLSFHFFDISLPSQIRSSRNVRPCQNQNRSYKVKCVVDWMLVLNFNFLRCIFNITIWVERLKGQRWACGCFTATRTYPEWNPPGICSSVPSIYWIFVSKCFPKPKCFLIKAEIPVFNPSIKPPSIKMLRFG